ncbi:MAG TPA: tetratricopeptide repeat protein, partial [Alphaproteobacteria bacterium]|nr:tetratricopeptide repeat protein [Alphaproteobacteria bacterium]
MLLFRNAHRERQAQIQRLQQSADDGDAEAQYELAERYFHGNGVEKDDGQAFEWFKQAANQELAKAQHALGLCYFYGIGVEKNKEIAFEWCEKASRQNFAMASYNCGVMQESGYTNRRPNLQRAFAYYALALGTDTKVNDLVAEKIKKNPLVLAGLFELVASQCSETLGILEIKIVSELGKASTLTL